MMKATKVILVLPMLSDVNELKLLDTPRQLREEEGLSTGIFECVP